MSEFKKFSSLENTYNKVFLEKVQLHPCYTEQWIATEKVHGCFQDRTRITLPDGTYKTIKEIVETKFDGEVLGVDSFGKTVATKVVNWHTNGEAEEWLKVTFKTPKGRGGNWRVVKCTANHKFYDGTEYKPIGEMKVGDDVEYVYPSFTLNTIQKQVLIGKMLGDGSLSNSSVAFGHKQVNEDYVDFTLKCLGSVAGNRQKNCVSGHRTVMCRGRSISSESIENLFSDWDKTSGTVPQVELTPIILAFWYMDDGSIYLNDKQRPRASFATCAFSEESCVNLIKSLSKIGLKATLTGHDKRWRIVLSADSTELMFSYICNLVPNSMKYKLPPHFRVHGSGIGLEKQAEHYQTRSISMATITKIEILKEKKQRYDIETETHNYFANNMHVHNCNFSFWWDKANGVRVASRTQFVDGSFFSCTDVIERHSETFARDCEVFNPDSVVVVYGELFGGNIQKEVKYGGKRFVAFDVTIDGVALPKWDALRFAIGLGFDVVPVISDGTLEDMLAISPEFVSPLAAEDVGEYNKSEGIVIEPVNPSYMNNGSRIYLKQKSLSFKEKKDKPVTKAAVEMSEQATKLLDLMLQRCTSQRVDSVISKLGEVTGKDFGKVVGLFTQDVLEEVVREEGVDIKVSSGDEWKMIQTYFAKETSLVVRNSLFSTGDK